MADDNPIERVAAVLQRLPPDVRWLAASMQGAIEEIAIGVVRRPGPRERRTRWILWVASHFGLERVLATAGGFVLLLWTWLSQFRAPVKRASSPLFIGIRALREPDLERRFSELVGRSPLSIDERRLDHFFRHGRIPMALLLREFLQVRRRLWASLEAGAPLGPLPWIDLVNFYLLRAWQYAYLRAWFRQYLIYPGASRLIGCTTASLTAYAAVAAGAEVVYMLHGFQRHSLVYPDYSRCVCFTRFDAAHVRRRLPACDIDINAPEVDRFDTKRVVALAGSFGDPDGFSRSRPFIEWAREHRLPVVVRKHPFDTSDDWEQWCGVSGIEVREAEGSFDDFLATVRPRFLASWHSTVLLDALVRGVIPVTLNADKSAVLVVYPIQDMALCWPRDRRLADSVVNDDRARDALVTRLIALRTTESTGANTEFADCAAS